MKHPSAHGLSRSSFFYLPFSGPQARQGRQIGLHTSRLFFVTSHFFVCGASPSVLEALAPVKRAFCGYTLKRFEPTHGFFPRAKPRHTQTAHTTPHTTHHTLRTNTSTNTKTQNAHHTHTLNTYTTLTLNTHAQPFQHTRTTHDTFTYTYTYTPPSDHQALAQLNCHDADRKPVLVSHFLIAH